MQESRDIIRMTIEEQHIVLPPIEHVRIVVCHVQRMSKVVTHLGSAHGDKLIEIVVRSGADARVCIARHELCKHLDNKPRHVNVVLASIPNIALADDVVPISLLVLLRLRSP